MLRTLSAVSAGFRAGSMNGGTLQEDSVVDYFENQ
jgi:hypothetical protein